MIPYYHTEALREALIEESRRWIGTPFMAHVRHPGVGVDCVNLAYALYKATGFAKDEALPAYHVGAGRHLPISQIIDWIRNVDRFSPIDLSEPTQTGDLLGIRMTGVVHHVAVATVPGFAVHATVTIGVFQQQIGTLKVTNIWRPHV